MVLLALVTFVIFHFGLDRNAIQGQLAAGVLTATLLFASMLGHQPVVRGRARARRL